MKHANRVCESPTLRLLQNQSPWGNDNRDLVAMYRNAASGECPLVVDTTNFSSKSYYMGSAENLHLTERFRRVAPDMIEYRVTIEDPTTWSRPWTAMLSLRRSDQNIYEFACHEGNDAMSGILSGERAQERNVAEKAVK